MTSIPASRSARAMILAPRSWPSRPGLATTTRILRAAAGSFTPGSVDGSELRVLRIRTEDFLQRRDHLALAHPSTRAVEQERHQVLIARRSGLQRSQRRFDGSVVTRCLGLLQATFLPALRLGI